MAEGVAVVQNATQVGLVLVRLDDLLFHGQTVVDQLREPLRAQTLRVQGIPQFPVACRRSGQHQLDDLAVTGGDVEVGQSARERGGDQHPAGRLEHTELVLERAEIDAALGADATVAHRQERRGNEDPADAAVVDVRGERGQVLDDPAADGHHGALLGGVVLLKERHDSPDAGQRLLVFRRVELERPPAVEKRCELALVQRAHVPVDEEERVIERGCRLQCGIDAWKELDFVVALRAGDRKTH